MNKKMMLAVFLAVAASGAARAEVAVGVEMAGYTPQQVSWSGSGRLELAAAELQLAVTSGDQAGAEARLADMFSGSDRRGGAASVALAALPAPAVPAPAAAPARANKAAALEDLEEAADAGAEASDSEAAAPGPLWQTLAAGLVGILIVMAVISLFPAAPLLLV